MSCLLPVSSHFGSVFGMGSRIFLILGDTLLIVGNDFKKNYNAFMGSNIWYWIVHTVTEFDSQYISLPDNGGLFNLTV